MGPKKAAEVKGTPKTDVNIAYFVIRNDEYEFSDKITVNTACRVDIILDYAKRQFVQRINKSIESINLSTTEETQERNKKVVSKLKEFQGMLTSTTTGNFVINSADGQVISFLQEDWEKEGATKMPMQASFDFGVSVTQKVPAAASGEGSSGTEEGKEETGYIFLHTGQGDPPAKEEAAAAS